MSPPSELQGNRREQQKQRTSAMKASSDEEMKSGVVRVAVAEEMSPPSELQGNRQEQPKRRTSTQCKQHRKMRLR
jgi:hypothetical protein